MKLTYIELKGEKHPLCYNLYAIEELCDVFGDLDAMTAAMNSAKQNVQIKAISSVLRALMDGGRAYCTETGIDMPKEIKNPSALIDITSPESVAAIFSAINSDSKTEIEVASKNVNPTQG